MAIMVNDGWARPANSPLTERLGSRSGDVPIGAGRIWLRGLVAIRKGGDDVRA